MSSKYIPEQKRIAKRLRISVQNITISPIRGKKYRVTLADGSKIDYGARGMSDFLMHRDEARRRRFHQRFRNNKGYNDRTSGLFYSARLLW